MASEGVPHQQPQAQPQTREQARAEYEKATQGLLFTKDFQTRQEALMRDQLATIGERVMAWVLRYSWGEYRLYAVKAGGEPAFQVDCARDLKIDKRRVTDAVGYLKKRGYLEDRGRLLYPTISPDLASPQTNSEGVVKKSGEYRTFLQLWKVAHSTDFEELEVARSTVKRIMKVLLSDYKKSRTGGTNGTPILIETLEIKTETKSSSSPVFSGIQEAEPEPQPEPPAKAEEEEGSLYQKFKTNYPAARFDEPKAKPAFENKTKAEKVRVLERLWVYTACDRWQDEDGRWVPFASKWLQSYDADPPPRLNKANARGSDERILQLMRGEI